MSIYAYCRDACGLAKEVFRKMSAALLFVCPECVKDAFRKQVTAAGFRLKSSGCYVTDFRGGSAGTGAGTSGEEASAGGEAAKPAVAPAATHPPPAISDRPAPDPGSGPCVPRSGVLT